LVGSNFAATVSIDTFARCVEAGGSISFQKSTVRLPLDHPRHSEHFPQQDGQPPADGKRAGEYDREFGECREGWIENDVLQPLARWKPPSRSHETDRRQSPSIVCHSI
jgi:hypothetical protein